MEVKEIIAWMVGGTAGTGGGLAVLYFIVRRLLTMTAKANLDTNSFGVAGELVKELRLEIVKLKEEAKNELLAERERAALALKDERERSEKLRNALEKTTIELYKVREKLSELTNSNIDLQGQVQRLETEVRTMTGHKDV